MIEEVCNYAPPKYKRQKIVMEDSHFMAVAAASSWSDVWFLLCLLTVSFVAKEEGVEKGAGGATRRRRERPLPSTRPDRPLLPEQLPVITGTSRQ